LDDLELRITFKIIDETVHRIPRRNIMGSRAAVPLELEIEASTARVAPSLAMVNLPSIRSCLVAIGRHLESFNIDEARW
jgi:hypothetical protein